MLKWISKKRNQKGFTLIELVVVIAILGILAAIAIPRLTKSRETAAKNTHNANVRTIESAMSIYQADHGVLPYGIDNLITDYLKENPTNPMTNTKNAYSISNGVVTPGHVD